MFEAIRMVQYIQDHFNLNKVQDGGADLRVVVTDTAGNSATLWWDKTGGRWLMDEGVDMDLMMLRAGDEDQRTQGYLNLQKRGWF